MHSHRIKGVIRNRTNLFNSLRLSFLSSEPRDHKENESSLNENGRTSLLGNDSSKLSSLPMIELTSFNEGHHYEDTFKTTNILYEELKLNMINLKTEQQRRIIPKFDEDENIDIDKNIKELIITMTDKVKKCEMNIKSLSNAAKNGQSNIVKDNMRTNLAEKLRDFTKEFRQNEEKYMAKYKELVGEHTIEKIDEDNESSKISSNFLQTSVEVDLTLQKRDNEITILLNSIGQLSTIFQDLQTLVQEQGTILDRIDYNIETALEQTIDAHKHLVKADEAMKKSCFRTATMILLIAIFIESILLLFKFMN